MRKPNSIRGSLRTRLAAVKHKKSLLVVLAVFAVGGVYMLQGSFAATYSAMAELEQGALAGNAAVVTDQSASGGKAVSFKSGGGTTTPPTPSGPAEATVTIDGIKYPNPLRLNSGNAVTTSAVWESTRRAEILADFRQNVYGTNLPNPTNQTFNVTPTDFPKAKRKVVKINVTGTQGSGSFTMNVFIPKTDGKPKGTFMLLDHRGSASDDPNQTSSYSPVSQINAAGYAFAYINTGAVAPDSNSYRNGAINWFYGSGNLPNNAGRAVNAWAWAASRGMDYLQTDPDIDASKIAVIGHSRSGKASLWAGAQDTRFAVVISNDSGSTGAKLARRGDGGVGAETVARINSSFPYWFPDTYKAFNNKESSLPVDQHELLALVAPRRVVVASATDDSNADPKGEFLSYVAASQVYKLYGLENTGLPSPNWQPATNKDFRGPAMSYHLRTGGHGLTMDDWNIYLNGNLFSR